MKIKDLYGQEIEISEQQQKYWADILEKAKKVKEFGELFPAENPDLKKEETPEKTLLDEYAKDIELFLKNPEGNDWQNFKTSLTGSVKLDEFVKNLKKEKPGNEQISMLADFVTQVVDNKVVLKDNIKITDDIKDILNRYRSGGVLREDRGVLDEYYTDIQLVEAVRNLIKDNLKTGSETFAKSKIQNSKLNVLEPSVGMGNFLYAVKDLGIKTDSVCFEINDTTAKIAKIFHPEVEINLRSFESEFIEENGQKKTPQQTYDLVVGNPPYGEHRGFYKGLGEEPNIAKYEDYFVKRSLDVLKEGCVLAMILPSGWLNRQTKLKHADLSQAYRLPEGAFEGTKIGTDIVILRKNSGLKETQNLTKYFEENPENILGEVRQKTNRWGRQENYVHGTLQDALEKLKDLREGNFENEIFNKIEHAEKPKRARLPKIIPGQMTIFDLLEITEQEIKDEAKEIAQAWKEENMEKFHENKTAENKKDILLQNNYKIHKSKKVDNQNELKYLRQTKPLIRKNVLKYEFHKGDNIVEAGIHNDKKIDENKLRLFEATNYDGTIRGDNEWGAENCSFYKGKFYNNFYYLSGDIYEKLEQLERDKDKMNFERYEYQKTLLESVKPKVKSLDEIILSPNHEFVHNFHLGYVQKERYNSEKRQNETVTVAETLAERFKDFVRTLPEEAFLGSNAFEVQRFTDNEKEYGSDKDYNALVRERRKNAANDIFSKFLKEEISEELKAEITEKFNRNYNNTFNPDYKQFPLFSQIYENFKGGKLNLTEVQKAGIGRLTTKGVGLLAHEVGFGKTLSGVLAMHEAMTRGNAKRPLIAVPNDSILKQWFETIFEVVPNAKVNVLGNLGVNFDLSKFNNTDGEITLVTYDGFNNLGFKKEISDRLAANFSYITEAETKNIVSARDFQLEQEKQKEISGKMQRGKVYDWEDFGFDHLTFDEVHNANHIISKVRIEDKQFASEFRNQNQKTSQIGINTWMAAQYIQDKYDGRNVTLLSATPFTNKPLEYYSILSLIANKTLERQGFYNVNTFFETFMEADNDMEIDAKGDIKYKTNIRRFKNNGIFQDMLKEFIDIKSENEDLIRPERINKEYKIKQNNFQKQQYENLYDLYDESKGGAILTYILNARKIAISPYLSPYFEGKIPEAKEFVENSPKLKTTMDSIAQNRKDNAAAGQIIYSELAVEHFPKLRNYLVDEVGYDESEVAIICGATSKNRRMQIQEKFNSGEIKVVIGSEAIQEGMNLQENTTDLYLLSLPYNFTSLRQTEGRMWRQDNRWERCRINYMLTNDSIDVFMLQKLQWKQDRYMEAMKSGANTADVGDVDAQELKTAIITDPEKRAEIDISVKRKQLEYEIKRFEADNAFANRKYKDYFEAKQKYEGTLGNYKVHEKLFKEGNKYVSEDDVKSWQRCVERDFKSLNFEKQKLSAKGINAESVEKHSEETNEKIAEIKSRIETLPQQQKQLAKQYRAEKENKQEAELRQNSKFIEERAQENKTFFVKAKVANLEKIKNTEAEILDLKLNNNPQNAEKISELEMELEKLKEKDNKLKMQFSEKNFTPISKPEFDKLIEILQKTGLQNRVVTDKNEFLKYISENKPEAELRQLPYGFVAPDKTIYFDLEKINANTPLHEFGHLWNVYIKDTNPALYEQGKNLVLNSNYFKEVSKNPAYAHLSQEDKIDEALAKAIGNNGERMYRNGEILDEDPEILKWLKALWDFIKEQILKFVQHSKSNIQNHEIDLFAENAVKELTTGKPLNAEKENNLQENQKIKMQYEYPQPKNFIDADRYKILKNDNQYVMFDKKLEKNICEGENLQDCINNFEKYRQKFEPFLKLNFSEKQAENLLENRVVKINETDFVRLHLPDDKAESELRFEIYKNIPTEKIAEYSGVIFKDENHKKEIVKSLEQGNITDVKFNFENKIFSGKATLNVQYKTLNLYDENMNRINTNKAVLPKDFDNIAENKENDVKRRR